MGEAIPFTAGIAIGLGAALAPRLSQTVRWLLGSVLVVVAGLGATWINGETVEFLPFDVVLVGLCATAAASGPALVRRARTGWSRARTARGSRGRGNSVRNPM